jgi:hypothetical protein
MSDDVRGVPDRVVDLFEGNDPLLIVGTMLGIYVLLTAAAVAVGFDLNGIVNTLRAATVFAAGYTGGTPACSTSASPGSWPSGRT